MVVRVFCWMECSSNNSNACLPDHALCAFHWVCINVMCHETLLCFIHCATSKRYHLECWYPNSWLNNLLYSSLVSDGSWLECHVCQICGAQVKCLSEQSGKTKLLLLIKLHISESTVDISCKIDKLISAFSFIRFESRSLHLENKARHTTPH